MDFNLEKFLKRYVWDEEKTPYFTPASKLNKRQASYESLAYAVFAGSLFTAVGLISMSGAGEQGREVGPALFSFSFVCAAIIFGMTRHYISALWLSTAPIAAITYFIFYGLKPKWAVIDQVVVLAFVGVWILYSLRVVAIGRHYENMPEVPPKQ